MSQSDSSQYTWAGRFSEPMSELVKRYTASVNFDRRMWRQDIRASLAHATMLARQGNHQRRRPGRYRARHGAGGREIESGSFVWSLDLEDVHLNIEKRLTALVGDAGKRLHTGRSRNDQVATDIRLYLRDAIDDIAALLGEFQTSLLDLAEREAATPLPGFTHLQVAQPVTFGHHLLAYFEMCDVTPSASPTAADAPTVCPSVQRRWPAPPIRSTAISSPSCWASTGSAKTRSMPFPTATLRSNSVPPARC
jgi:argininosuccinate lyase